MRRFVLVLASVGVLGVIVWSVVAGVRLVTPTTLPAVRSGPVYDGPAVVDVGEREIYSLAVAHFTIKNPGDEELVLGGVRTGCACTGVVTLNVRVGEADHPVELEVHCQTPETP